MAHVTGMSSKQGQPDMLSRAIGEISEIFERHTDEDFEQTMEEEDSPAGPIGLPDL